MSRLAGGSPEMYRDICLTNEKAIVARLDMYIDVLQKIRDSIYLQDKHLGDMFVEAQRQRLQWLAIRDFSEPQ